MTSAWRCMAVTRAMRHATGSKQLVGACRLHRTVWREWQNTQHIKVDRRRGINDGKIGKTRITDNLITMTRAEYQLREFFVDMGVCAWVIDEGGNSQLTKASVHFLVYGPTYFCKFAPFVVRRPIYLSRNPGRCYYFITNVLSTIVKPSLMNPEHGFLSFILSYYAEILASSFLYKTIRQLLKVITV